MTAEIKERLRQAFEAQLPRVLPGFAPIAPFHPNVISVFRCHAAPNLYLFIVIAGRADDNDFTIELAWGRDDQFPLGKRPRSPWNADRTYKEESLTGDGFRLRADRLWGMRRDFWWSPAPREKRTTMQMLADLRRVRIEAEKGKLSGETDEEFVRRVEAPVMSESNVPVNDEVLRPLVDDACEKIAAYVVPYFGRVVTRHGG